MVQWCAGSDSNTSGRLLGHLVEDVQFSGAIARIFHDHNCPGDNSVLQAIFGPRAPLAKSHSYCEKFCHRFLNLIYGIPFLECKIAKWF